MHIWVVVSAVLLLAVVKAEKMHKVFGVGLSKTGTTSLGVALESLGYRNIHNDRGCVPFLFEDGAVRSV